MLIQSEPVAAITTTAPLPRLTCNALDQLLRTTDCLLAQAYMLISIPTGTSTILGAVQLMLVLPERMIIAAPMTATCISGNSPRPVTAGMTRVILARRRGM